MEEITENKRLLRGFYGILILFTLFTGYLVIKLHGTRQQIGPEHVAFQEDMLRRSVDARRALHATCRILQTSKETVETMVDTTPLVRLSRPLLENRVLYPEIDIIALEILLGDGGEEALPARYEAIRSRYSAQYDVTMARWRRVLGARDSAERSDAWRVFQTETAFLADTIHEYNSLLDRFQSSLSAVMRTHTAAVIRNLKIYFFCLLFLAALTVLIAFFFAVRQRRSEKLLLESRAHYRGLSENSADCIVRYDPDLRIIYANGAMSRVARLPAEELTGSTHQGIGIPEPLAAQLDHLIERVFAENRPRSLQFELTSGEETMVMDWRAVPEFSDRGDVRTVMAVSRDITALVKSEMELRKTKSQLQAILDHSPALISIRDPDGRILLANRRFSVLGHSDPDRVVGKTLFDLYPEEIAFAQMKSDHEVMETGATREIEEHFEHTDGMGHDYFTIKFPLYSPSKSILGVCSISSDISSRKKAEEEKTQLMSQLQHSRKMDAIGTLVGGIAHDFNNLLGIIIGNTELAMDEVDASHPAGGNLEEIRNAGMRARNVVRQLLGFTRKSDPARRPMDIRPVVRDCLELIRASMPATIAIETEIEETASRILADSDQIHQMLVHLCTNAAQAMETTGGTLRLGVHTVLHDRDAVNEIPGLSPGTFLRISIADTGCGIPEENMSRIFDPYFTTREFGKGGGMGLSVVHGIVKGHDGVIRVSSETGAGTVFEAYFPVLEEIRETDLTDHDGPLRGGGERILFVDDEISMARMGQLILERLGYSVRVRSDPVAALHDFRSADPGYDLVITDMTMPQMTGDLLARKILEHRPRTPIILCTGYSERMDAAGAEKLGIQLYLEKPVNKKMLARSVRQVLDACSQEGQAL